MDTVRNRKIPNGKSKGSKKYLKQIEDLNEELKNERMVRKEKCDDMNEKSDKNWDEFLKGGVNDREKKKFLKENLNEIEKKIEHSQRFFNVSVTIDLVAVVLFFCGLVTRIYKLDEPKNIVFDELHYGKYVSHYIKNTFFFDVHPPLGKQLVATAAYVTGYNGKFKFDRIGSPYSDTVPLFALRFIPAIFGSLLMPTAYHLMLVLGLKQSTAVLAGLLLLFDNALLTQSRFILMESMLLFFSLFGILCVLKFRQQYSRPYSLSWWFWLICSCISLTCSLCVKYVGFYSFCLGLAILGRDFWKVLSSPEISDKMLFLLYVAQSFVLTVVPILVYLGVFYIHLRVLFKAGPHDSIMTSAFQASLDGGLASITRGQPLLVAHGSQITLRHTHGRTCWLHSHTHVYPIRYPDKRGSSHQQQVTCYSFKDVNNWWIIKKPDKNDLVVEQPVDAIKHGDVIQLVHGITSRALNSHDVAAPMSPQSQEVSCYIDYNVSMPAQNLWRVDIINKDQFGYSWHTIQSLVRLIHVDSGQALKFSGRQLPDWGFHQHEVVADRIINQDDTVWNVEEHRYTKSDDQKERERELVTAEMIPTSATQLSFWDKFYELNYKMMFPSSEGVQNHMYSSEPTEWPLMSRGIAYWVSNSSNAQIHLLGNVVIWYSGSFSLLIYLILLTFYLLRRHRFCFDLDEKHWQKFQTIGEVFLLGYFFNYLPYFFVERSLFLHHYLPAFVYKVLLMAALFEHIYYVLKDIIKIKILTYSFLFVLFLWFACVFYVFKKFLVLSYGMTELTMDDILDLRWKESWDFVVHKS